MIDPENNIQPDDASNETDDQQSQQDIHSDGFDNELLTENEDDSDQLAQADAASSPSYLLDVDHGIIDDPEEISKED